MIILFSAKYFYPEKGGGEKSAITLLKYLSKTHKIYVLCEGTENEIIKINKNLLVIHRRVILKNLNKFVWFKRYIQNLFWKYILNKFIPHLKPQIIITQLEYSMPTISLANKYKIPSILFIRHFFYFCPFGFRNSKRKFCIKNCNECNLIRLLFKCIWKKEMLFESLFLIKLIKWNIQTLQNSNLIISNSSYSAQKLVEFFNINSEIIYPFINNLDYKIDKIEKKYITMINPTRIKGVKIFIEIAKIQKKLQFIAVGKTDKEIQVILNKLENMTYIDWVDDIKTIYAKTHILLIPSKDEPFGRVAVEAMLNGIPVIGSNSGALPEIIPQDLIVKNLNAINEWIEKLNLAIKRYPFYSELVRNKAKQFNLMKMINKFQNIVNLKLGLTI